MIIDKITVGFVIQKFDTDKQAFVSQDFVAGDDVTYEVEGDEINYGNFLDRVIEKNVPYLALDMVQPDEVSK